MEINTDGGIHYVNDFPDECPFCHKGIIPKLLYGHKHSNSLEVIMFCPNAECNKSFIGYYFVNIGSNNATFTNKTSQGTIIGRNFSPKIIEISASFVNIYNQALVAEQQDLNEICGVGYRKALEFLIKEYSILNNETEKEKIEKTAISKVIDQYVNDIRIKAVSKRATWLGNDETHYIRKWEGKNLEDLKKLIDLTVHWIEMEALTSSFESEMPEK